MNPLWSGGETLLLLGLPNQRQRMEGRRHMSLAAARTATEILKRLKIVNPKSGTRTPSLPNTPQRFENPFGGMTEFEAWKLPTWGQAYRQSTYPKSRPRQSDFSKGGGAAQLKQRRPKLIPQIPQRRTTTLPRIGPIPFPDVPRHRPLRTPTQEPKPKFKPRTATIPRPTPREEPRTPLSRYRPRPRWPGGAASPPCALGWEIVHVPGVGFEVRPCNQYGGSTKVTGSRGI